MFWFFWWFVLECVLMWYCWLLCDCVVGCGEFRCFGWKVGVLWFCWVFLFFGWVLWWWVLIVCVVEFSWCVFWCWVYWSWVVWVFLFNFCRSVLCECDVWVSRVCCSDGEVFDDWKRSVWWCFWVYFWKGCWGLRCGWWWSIVRLWWSRWWWVVLKWGFLDGGYFFMCFVVGLEWFLVV